MMIFYKSFFFLFILDFLIFFLIWLVFGISFFIFGFVFIFSLNCFLLFFTDLYFKRISPFSVFAPDDPYGLYSFMENLKKDYQTENIKLLKTKKLNHSFFCFSKGRKGFIVLSEDLIERLSREEIYCLLVYAFEMARSGDMVFFSILSRFIFLLETLLYFISYPLYFFRGKTGNENLILVFFLKALSFITKMVFTGLDQSFKFREREKQGFLLWRLHSLAKTTQPKVSFFMAPLFLINPLTGFLWGCYISLQPPINKRLEALGVFYPP